MLIDLTRENLVHLVAGTEPDHSKITELQKTTLGAYSGSYSRWSWNRHQLAKLQDGELLGLYCYITDTQPLEGTAPAVELKNE